MILATAAVEWHEPLSGAVPGLVLWAVLYGPALALGVVFADVYAAVPAVAPGALAATFVEVVPVVDGNDWAFVLVWPAAAVVAGPELEPVPAQTNVADGPAEPAAVADTAGDAAIEPESAAG
jgi:hypothetical protein